MVPGEPLHPDPEQRPGVGRRRLLASAAALVGGAGAGAILSASPASAAPAPAPGAGRGGVVDVTDHGAVGDGVAVDTTAIQSAVDQAAARGGIVRFPPGHYRLAAPGIRITRPVQLEGVGWEGTAVEEGAGEKAPVPSGSWLFVDDPTTAAITVEAAPAANPPSGISSVISPSVRRNRPGRACSPSQWPRSGSYRPTARSRSGSGRAAPTCCSSGCSSST